MQKIQTQGLHHITLNGADRQTSIDFWEGLLGMPFLFEQPNLDAPDINHLYFDPGDGRLITVFTDESRKKDPAPTPNDVGTVHHIAFSVSRVVFNQIAQRLEERGIPNSGHKDRGFMDSFYFRDPLGHLIELACYKFEPPDGFTHAMVLAEAHNIRVARGDPSINDVHLADAIEDLVRRSQPSLSANRGPKQPY
ncbi:VOC family protein [Stappia sp. F7233]|uniref:VOC family protein n=1 Tax=Stappia albiluteola TaxID=2758565 RepID=A0A839AJH9_9HYPH|nr:VOC family protein [Stappia albiluteola]MBA5778649.1 VOC family protein [Stappia albiluteola]